jgi:hypothetical protein
MRDQARGVGGGSVCVCVWVGGGVSGHAAWENISTAVKAQYGFGAFADDFEQILQQFPCGR